MIAGRRFIVALFLALSLRAQDPNIFTSQWRAVFDASGYDGAAAIKIDAQTNVFVAGLTESSDTSHDGLLVKVSPTGQRLWARRFDSAISESDQFTSLAIDAAGNATVAGLAAERDTPNSLLVASYAAANGATRWLKLFPGSHITTPEVAVDGAGNVYTRTGVENGVGQTIRTYKFTPAGAPLWTNEISAARDLAFGLNSKLPLLVQPDGSSFLCALTTSTAGDLNWLVLRLRADGSEQWRTTLGGTNYESQPLIALHSSGDLLVAGSSENNGGALDILIERLNPGNGARVWQTRLRGSSAFKAGSHVLADIKSDSIGNVWLAGNSPTWGGFVSRFDLFGNFDWTTHFPHDARAILPFEFGQAFLAVGGGLAWVDDDGSIIKSELARLTPVVAGGPSGTVHVANSVYKPEARGDFSLTIEKLTVDRHVLAPTLLSVPEFTTAAPLQNVQLTPLVMGTDLTFIWLHNGQIIPGATNQTLLIPSVNASSIGYYSVQVSNPYGNTLSRNIEVLTATPIFIRQPRSQTFAYGGDVAFSALAVGFEPQLDVTSILTTYLTYQWYYENFPLVGETRSKLLIREADETWLGRYWVRATLFYPDLNLSFFADSEVVNLSWSAQDVDEVWREQFLLTGQPWSRPNGFDIKPNGDVALSLQSPTKLVRASIANREVLSDVAEKFKPAKFVPPKGPHFPDSQGNFYSIGETNLLDTSVDWVVAKHAANGTLLWQQTISSLARGIDHVIDAVVDANDNIIVTGWGSSEETGVDAVTVSLNKADGTLRWNNAFDDPSGIRVSFAGEIPGVIAIDKSGNTFVTGTGFWTDAGFYFLVSYDTNGATRFRYQRPWMTNEDAPPKLAIDPDGIPVMAGTFGLLKVGPQGRELWVSDLRPSLESPPPLILGIQVDRSGNIYLSGHTVGGGAFAKFDAFGRLRTQTTFDTTFPESSFLPSSRFFVDDFGNTYLPGSGGNINSEQDILAVKLNPYLHRFWMARVDGLSENRDEGLEIKVQGENVFLVGSALGENTMEASVVKFKQYPLLYQVKDITSSKTVRRGSALRLEGQAFGNPPFYQWYKNEQPIDGARSAVYDISNVSAADEGFYVLQVYDAQQNQATGAGFAIRVADPPAIDPGPASTNVFVKGRLFLSAGITGTEPLFFQWRLNGAPIIGATNRTFTIENAQYSDRGDYRLIVTNAWGAAASSDAKVTISAPPNLPPIVRLTEPADRLVQRAATPVQLRATAYDADGRITQVTFRVNGSSIATVGVPPFERLWTPPGPGIFQVTATATDNLAATTTSQEVEIVVAPPPIIIKHPPGQVALAENSDLTLEAEATSSPPPRYQWRLNGANIPGATNRSYTINGAQARNSGRYAVLAINEGSAAISSRTEVIVEAPAVNLADEFANAITLNDVQFVGRGNNRDARKEPGEPNHARRRGGRSVWLRWRAPTGGVMSISTRGSAIDTLLAIYTGDTVSQLSQVAADDERGGFHCSATRFNAVKGQLYHIAIDGFKGQGGNIIVSWTLDTSSRELPVITGEPDSVSSRLGSVAAYHVDALGNNLKYQWYLNGYPVPGATDSGLVLFDVAGRNLGDYVVRVTGDGGSVESEVAELELGGATEPVTQDRVEDLLSETAAAPDQNGLAKAVAGYPTISPGIPYRKFFNTAGATADDSEPVLGDGGGASKWFFVTAGGSGTLVADTIGSDFPNMITLHDPSDTETLPVLAQGVALAGGASRAAYPATNGMTFLIRVDGIDEREGNVVLNITIGSEPAVLTAATDTVISAGDSATLTASVSAAPAATYQWYLNDIPLPGQTSTTLQLTGFDPAQAGIYAFEASNALGSVKKTIAYVELARDVLFDSPTILPNGSMELRLEGNTRTYFIDFTADFQTWMNLFNGRAENGLLQYNITPPGNQQSGFYRARWE